MASEAAKIIAELRAGGTPKKDIAAAIGRDPKMIWKVQNDKVPGTKYVMALRQLQRGDTVTVPLRNVRPGEQMTPAGRVISVTGAGMIGLYQGLARDRLGSAKASVQVEWTDSRGRPRVGTLYANGGRARGAIVDDLDALGADPADPESILDALVDLIDLESGDNDGGASGLGGVGSGTITGVLVSPA